VNTKRAKKCKGTHIARALYQELHPVWRRRRLPIMFIDRLGEV